MKRRLFAILPALSLLLSLVMAMLCLRSYWTWDAIAFGQPGGHQWRITSESGRVEVAIVARSPAIDEGYCYYSRGPSEPASFFGPLTDSPGFRLGLVWDEYWTAASDPGEWHHGLIIGYGHLIALAGTYPLCRFARLCIKPLRSYRSRIRRQNGFCPTCGYDLRVSKDHCPECGTPIVADKSEQPARTLAQPSATIHSPIG